MKKLQPLVTELVANGYLRRRQVYFGVRIWLHEVQLQVVAIQICLVRAARGIAARRVVEFIGGVAEPLGLHNVHQLLYPDQFVKLVYEDGKSKELKMTGVPVYNRGTQGVSIFKRKKVTQII